MIALRPLLELCRIPNVFTALADILAGYLALSEGVIVWQQLVGLLAASACLYIAGMVLNDFFDRRQDGAERPHRPIPSGRISPRFAVVFGTGLLLAGCAFGATVSIRSGLIAIVIAAAVLLYNGLLKRTAVASILMGICRGLNLLLGMSTFDSPFVCPAQLVIDSHVELPIVWLLPLAMLVYITGLTWFGRREAAHSSRLLLIAALCLQITGLLIALTALLLVGPRNIDFLVPLAFVAITNGRTGLAAVKAPDPLHVQTAVKTGISNIIVFDAAIVLALQGFDVSLAVFALLLPTWLLGRWIHQT